MGLTFTLHEDLKMPFGVGSHNELVCYMVPDSSYPTGGYVYASSTVNGLSLGLSLRTIMAIIPIGGDTSAVGYQVYQNFETGKVMILSPGAFTPAGTLSTSAVTGTAAAQAFTGSALAAHGHVLHFQTSAAANAVTAATNNLRTAAAAFDVASVANNSGEGGIVQLTAGTPAGTNATSAVTGTAAAQTFTGTAVTAAAAEVANLTDLSALRFLVRIIGR